MGYKIGFEGEAEFMKALREMNAELKTLKTEMQLVTSAFDKEDQSQEKLTAQSKVLNKDRCADAEGACAAEGITGGAGGLR